MNKNMLRLAVVFLTTFATEAFAQYSGWQHQGSMFILTTPEGANLPATASVEDFPLLVRLKKDAFDFSQAKPHGEDIRFSADGKALACQVEQWDAAAGVASIWVRIPAIQGNARQEITMVWGKPDAQSESKGSAVFRSADGYASVLHMDESLQDELNTIMPKDEGTTAAPGRIGQARHFTPGKGIQCGDHITEYPYGDNPFTSEAWFRTETAGSTILYWGRYATRLNGNTGDGNEVGINIGSPASLGWTSDGPGGAAAATAPAMGQWTHVAAVYENGTSKIYVNGNLDGSNYHKAAMSVIRDIGMSIGGMRGGNYNFAGDIDEVRVSHLARSADWIKLEYENQKAQQTLVGSLVPPGSAFSVSPSSAKIAEGKSATFTAQAGGAQKVYWIVHRDGEETVVAVDQLSYTLPAGRVTKDTSLTLQFKAVFAKDTKIKDIPITIQEDIPEPVVALKAPVAWNGRDAIEVIPKIGNLSAMKAKDAGELRTLWTVAGGAVIKEIAADRLILKRSQYSGPLTVRAAVNNGGADSVAAANILVTEPKQDAWVERTPEKDEKPEENQFYARDDKNEGTLFYNGTLDQDADAVFLKVYADGKIFKTENRKLSADRSYAFTVKLKPGLIEYKVEFGVKKQDAETVLKTVNNLVCGDAYLIDGQSNAEATGPNNGPAEDPVTPVNHWIRSYGNQHEGTIRGGWGDAVRTHIWGKPNYGCHQIGAWGTVLAANLVEKQRMPICIINGSYGGTPIWQHQPNPDNRFDSSGEFYRNPYKIYGSLLTRVTAARLTHGIRGVLWHQGENDSGSGAPTGDYNYRSYQQYFIDMSAAWKEDYPNIQRYYLFQVWPLPCGMGPKDDQVREAQRTLPQLYSNMRVMSTLGVVSPSSGRGLCHFDLEGYAQLAKLMEPLVELDNYGLAPKQAVTAPNLRRAWFTGAANDEIALDFGQPMAWSDAVKKNIYLDDVAAPIASASVSENVVTLKLAAPSHAQSIAYLMGRDWDGKAGNLLYGANGIAALTFCDIPIEPSTAKGERAR